MKEIPKKNFWDNKPITTLILIIGILGALAFIGDAFFSTSIISNYVNSDNAPMWVIAYILVLGFFFNVED